MAEAKLVRVDESEPVGRWVVAEFEVTTKRFWEFTFAPDITPREWDEAGLNLPASWHVDDLSDSPGAILGCDGPVMTAIISSAER